MGTFIKGRFTTTDSDAPALRELYFLDSFNRPDGVPGNTEVGHLPWIFRTGTYHIKNNELSSGDTTAATPADCNVVATNRDGIITAVPTSLGAGQHAGIIFGGDASGNTCYDFYASSTDHKLARRTGSDSFTVIPLTGASLSFTPGETMTVTRNGNRIICAVNGIITHDVIDSTYNGYEIGVTTRMATAANPATWDSFSFSAL